MGVDIFISTRNTSYTITADVEVAANGNGVIVCQGGRFGGFSFYVKDGKPCFTYNYFGLESYTITSAQALKPGSIQLYMISNMMEVVGKGGKEPSLLMVLNLVKGELKKHSWNIFCR